MDGPEKTTNRAIVIPSGDWLDTQFMVDVLNEEYYVTGKTNIFVTLNTGSRAEERIAEWAEHNGSGFERYACPRKNLHTPKEKIWQQYVMGLGADKAAMFATVCKRTCGHREHHWDHVVGNWVLAAIDYKIPCRRYKEGTAMASDPEETEVEKFAAAMQNFIIGANAAANSMRSYARKFDEAANEQMQLYRKVREEAVRTRAERNKNHGG